MILLYSYQNLENCIHSQEKVNLYLKLVEKEKDRKNILSLSSFYIDNKKTAGDNYR